VAARRSVAPGQTFVLPSLQACPRSHAADWKVWRAPQRAYRAEPRPNMNLVHFVKHQMTVHMSIFVFLEMPPPGKCRPGRMSPSPLASPLLRPQPLFARLHENRTFTYFCNERTKKKQPANERTNKQARSQYLPAEVTIYSRILQAQMQNAHATHYTLCRGVFRGLPPGPTLVVKKCCTNI